MADKCGESQDRSFGRVTRNGKERVFQGRNPCQKYRSDRQ